MAELTGVGAENTADMIRGGVTVTAEDDCFPRKTRLGGGELVRASVKNIFFGIRRAGRRLAARAFSPCERARLTRTTGECSAAFLSLRAAHRRNPFCAPVFHPLSRLSCAPCDPMRYEVLCPGPARRTACAPGSELRPMCYLFFSAGPCGGRPARGPVPRRAHAAGSPVGKSFPLRAMMSGR